MLFGGSRKSWNGCGNDFSFHISNINQFCQKFNRKMHSFGKFRSFPKGTVPFLYIFPYTLYAENENVST